MATTKLRKAASPPTPQQVSLGRRGFKLPLPKTPEEKQFQRKWAVIFDLIDSKRHLEYELDNATEVIRKAEINLTLWTEEHLDKLKLFMAQQQKYYNSITDQVKRLPREERDMAYDIMALDSRNRHIHLLEGSMEMEESPELLDLLVEMDIADERACKEKFQAFQAKYIASLKK